jgi:hypothetical protein
MSRNFYYLVHLVLEKVKGGELLYNLYLDELKKILCFHVRRCSWCSKYSGHKRIHCLKYQTSEAPNGLILHCSVGDDGQLGNGCILCHSGLIESLQKHPLLHLFQVLGDSASLNNEAMISIYKGSIHQLHLLHSIQSCVLKEHMWNGDMKK